MQDGLFTHVIKGIDKGKPVEELHINAAISRCVHAEQDWQEILLLAESPDLEIIISNTTEVGIVLEEEVINQKVPHSFPAKLLAVLHQRFIRFGGDMDRGLVILPTELIDKNAKQLLFILNQLADFNQLSKEFKQWLNEANHFCNTLVDRIVTGKLSTNDANELQNQIGYHDDLMIMSEPFGLWAIETSKQQVIDRLQFINPIKGCSVVDDLHVYKELKLRLLNATHSFCCAYAIHNGFKTVKDAMLNVDFRQFVKNVIEEIKLILIEVETFPKEVVEEFADRVLDRFSNPYIDHKWESISLHYATKVKVRCLPLIRKAITLKNGRYQNMLKGLEEFNLFSHGELNEFLATEVYGKE
jgi:tagaturonate reductase